MADRTGDLQLPAPPVGRRNVLSWVGEHLEGLYSGPVEASSRFTGGQSAADAALAGHEVTGYAANRNEVWPEARRGASGLSPYIRHGLLSLPRVWDAVAGGPQRDVQKFRDELLWQEYARHLYARMGRATAAPLRHRMPAVAADPRLRAEAMACTTLAVDELETDGWLVNQTRMWLASHWAVRHQADWRSGEEWFFRHLLDGSRAANRLGWQWTTGLATGKSYGFSRRQVENRAPGLCATCPLRDACPIEDWPQAARAERIDPDPRLKSDPDPETTAGPSDVVHSGKPNVVWLTAESLGDDDPALVAHPDLTAVFVFDEALLARLRLTAKRLVFLVECLADLASRRPVEVHRGDPVTVLGALSPAVTFAPVPGFTTRSAAIRPAAVHPWPWLYRPHSGPVSSFSAWRKRVQR